MKAKLVNYVWANTTILPDGLTLNNEYKVIEVFYSNPYDKYFRIIDDNGEEQAWNSNLFEVTVKRPIDILKECIKNLEEMSEEEFNKAIDGKGIVKSEYSIEKYTDDTFHIILPINNSNH